MSRRITLPEAAAYDASVMARGVPGRALDALVQQGSFVNVSRLVHGHRRPAGLGPRRRRRQRLHDLVGGPVGRATRRSTSGGCARRRSTRSSSASTRTPRPAPPSRWSCAGPAAAATVELDGDGTADFPPIRTDQLALDVGDAEPATSVDFSGATGAVPVGITELRLGGAQGLPALLSDDRGRAVPCGTGPTSWSTARGCARPSTASRRDLFEACQCRPPLCGVGVAGAPRRRQRGQRERLGRLHAPSVVLGLAVSCPSARASPVEGGSDGIGRQRLVPEPGQRARGRAREHQPRAGWRRRTARTSLRSSSTAGARAGSGGLDRRGAGGLRARDGVPLVARWSARSPCWPCSCCCCWSGGDGPSGRAPPRRGERSLPAAGGPRAWLPSRVPSWQVSAVWSSRPSPRRRGAAAPPARARAPAGW